MNKETTIKENKTFNILYKYGKSVVTKYFVIYYKENKISKSRLGITVSKKIGTSVKRNRAKRLIRESIRLINNKIYEGHDIIIVCRVAINDVKRQDIDRAMWYALNKSGLIKNKKYNNKEQ